MGVGALKKGYIKNKTTGEVKSFLFNPESISDSRTVNFSEISAPGSSYPVFQYVNTGARTMSLNLFLANTSKGTAKEYLNFIDKFLPTGKKFSKPPILVIAMGTDVRECLLNSLNRTITDFETNLEIKRATITLNLTVLIGG